MVESEPWRRQTDLPGMDETAKEKLAKAKVLVAGLSGSGSIAAYYLALLNLGTIGLIDDETLTLNYAFTKGLTRSDRLKATAGLLASLNPSCRIVSHEQVLSTKNIDDIIASYDLVIESLIDWQTKLLLSDSCMHIRKPLVHNGLNGYRLQVFTMVPGKSACLRCLFHEQGLEDFSRMAPNQSIFEPAAGIAGALAASETIRLIANLGIGACDELVQFDCLRREFDSLRGLSLRQDCPDCAR